MSAYEQYCGLALALERVGGRWTLLVVRELLLGPRRFSDLVANLPHVPRNLLTARLRELEREGLVVRRSLPPPAVAAVYELSELGRGLEEAVFALVRWGGAFMRGPAEGLEFRWEWLAIALRALLAGRNLAALPSVLLRVGGGTVALRVERGALVALPGDGAGVPDLEISGTPPALLGLFAGAGTLSASERAGALEVKGSRRARTKLSRCLAG